MIDTTSFGYLGITAGLLSIFYFLRQSKQQPIRALLPKNQIRTKKRKKF